MLKFRTLLVRLTLILATTLGVVAATAAPSYAYTPYNSGHPGGLTTPQLIGFNRDLYNGSLTFPLQVASRSAAYSGYQQQVCLTTALNFANGQGTPWHLARSDRVCKWFTGTATTVIMPGATYLVPRVGIWAGTVYASWYLSNGTLIGQRTLVYNQRGDYWCSGCGVGVSDISGAYVAF